MKLYLASQSPRRRKLLDQIGVAYECLHVKVYEDWDTKEPAREYVARLALEKAQAGYEILRQSQKDLKNCVVLGADTSVVLDDVILGKATNAQEAENMLARLAGRCHHVYTGVAVVGANEQSSICLSRVNLNRVYFRPITSGELAAYCASEEPLGKAGGYAVQGEAALFIERLEGSYSGVMGLPLYETGLLLSACVVPLS